MAPNAPPRPAHPPPTNWPSEVHYLTAPFYVGLPAEVQVLIQSQTPPPVHKPNPNVEIRLIDNPAHPAHGQRGLFAKRKLAKGELIVWYTGHVHLDPEPDPVQRAVRDASDYDLTLVPQLSRLVVSVSSRSSNSDTSDEPRPAPAWATLGVAVDASRMGNEARFINDYRGVPPPAAAAAAAAAASASKASASKAPVKNPARSGKGAKRPAPAKSKPNAFFHSVRTRTLVAPPVLNPEQSTPLERMAGAAGELRMGVFVLAPEGIAKGEEILISYGKSFWASRGISIAANFERDTAEVETA